MPDPLPAAALVAGLEGGGLPRPFWSLAALPRLRTLHLQAPVSSAEAGAVFDAGAAGLSALAQLSELSLGSWQDFRLDAAPPSLRRLRLRYDAQARALAVPQLPPHIRRGQGWDGHPGRALRRCWAPAWLAGACRARACADPAPAPTRCLPHAPHAA